MAALFGCGGKTERAATTTPATPAAEANPHRVPLVYVWRNFELTGIPDELTVYRDGSVRYRYLLHTQRSIPVQTARLRLRALRSLRTLVRRVDLRRADASGLKPVRSGYRYVIRSAGRTGTAADGHLRGPLRRLLVRVDAEMDRLQRASL
jgi:hypothetical protein